MNIVVEKLTAADAADILAYLKQAGRETDNLTFGGEGLPVSIESEIQYIRSIENSCDGVMFVAKENGRIVGNVGLNRLSRRMKHRGDLSISVLKDYWNQGVGSKLLCAVLDFAKKHSFEIIDLQVRSDNVRAIHLYEKYGFRKIGTHPAFFKMGEKEIPFDYMFLKIQ